MNDPGSSDARGAAANERGLSAPRVGDVLGGKYEILRLIGEGGMGAVFDAENKVTQKRVAIKWLHPDLSSESGAAARLLREAQAASRIRHSNVVDVYDVEREGNSIFLVMELLDGETLTCALARRDLPIHALIALLIPAMRGVAAAHRQGVIHRDVKPDNIFLAREEDSPRPVAKVLDFGISKLEERGRAQPSLTRTGNAVGTPLYMSYEQLSGDRAIDGRADVYAFGVILYEALTGRLPFDANSLPKLVVKIATQTAVPPIELHPELPDSLSRVVMRALSRQRDDRTPSMEALIADLAPFASEQGYQAELANAATTTVDSVRPVGPDRQFLAQATEHALPLPGRAQAGASDTKGSDAATSAPVRPFPFLGRTEHRRRFVPVDDGLSQELRAQSLPTPRRSVLKSTRSHSLRKSVLVALTLSAGAALLWRTTHPLDRSSNAQSPAASAVHEATPLPDLPATGKALPTLPTSPSPRSTGLGADDWTPDRSVQVLGSEEAHGDAAVAPSAQAEASRSARERTMEQAQPQAAPVTARPRRTVRRFSARAPEGALRPPAQETTTTVTAPVAPSESSLAVEVNVPADTRTPFRVHPPRSEDF